MEYKLVGETSHGDAGDSTRNTAKSAVWLRAEPDG